MVPRRGRLASRDVRRTTVPHRRAGASPSPMPAGPLPDSAVLRAPDFAQRRWEPGFRDRRPIPPFSGRQTSLSVVGSPEFPTVLTIDEVAAFADSARTATRLRRSRGGRPRSASLGAPGSPPQPDSTVLMGAPDLAQRRSQPGVRHRSRAAVRRAPPFRATFRHPVPDRAHRRRGGSLRRFRPGRNPSRPFSGLRPRFRCLRPRALGVEDDPPGPASSGCSR